MIPLRDELRAERRPIVNTALILANILVFVYQLTLGPELELFVVAFGLVPGRLTSPEAWDTLGPGIQAVPVFVHMFLHGSWLHLISNTWFLFIFGDNVEGRMGHGRYLAFYLLSGLCGAGAQTLTAPSSVIPMIGASGAVSGVLGAYMLLFPHARVITLVPLLFLFYTIEVPALLFLGIWALLQVLRGTAELGVESGGGVAWWAHVGGFGLGALVVLLFPALRRPLAPLRRRGAPERFRRRRRVAGRAITGRRGRGGDPPPRGGGGAPRRRGAP